MSSVWAETIPNWIAATGTAGAAIVAVYLAAKESKRAEIAEDERDKLLADARTRVPRRVVGWIEKIPAEERRTIGVGLRAREGPRLRAKILNGSDEAITEVTVTVVHADQGEYTKLVSWPVLAPQSMRSEEIGFEVQVYNDPPELWLEFTDPSGRTWQRGRGGSLREQDGSDRL